MTPALLNGFVLATWAWRCGGRVTIRVAHYLISVLGVVAVRVVTKTVNTADSVPRYRVIFRTLDSQLLLAPSGYKASQAISGGGAANMYNYTD